MQIIYTNASVSKLQYAKSDKNIPESVTKQYDKNKGPKKTKKKSNLRQKELFPYFEENNKNLHLKTARLIKCEDEKSLAN